MALSFWNEPLNLEMSFCLTSMFLILYRVWTFHNHMTSLSIKCTAFSEFSTFNIIRRVNPHEIVVRRPLHSKELFSWRHFLLGKIQKSYCLIRNIHISCNTEIMLLKWLFWVNSNQFSWGLPILCQYPVSHLYWLQSCPIHSIEKFFHFNHLLWGSWRNLIPEKKRLWI